MYAYMYVYVAYANYKVHKISLNLLSSYHQEKALHRLEFGSPESHQQDKDPF